LDDPLDEQLNAYLDGELDADEVLAVESRLATDADYRGRLQQLQRTWDMLDALPAAHSSPSFTESTLELVFQNAATELRRRNNKWWVWPVRITVLLAVPLATVLASFQISRYAQQAPNRRLVKDLPVIENVFVYERADSIEFLNLLEKDGVFAEQADE
jgi:anti-sigma factor RsiW